MSARSDVLHAEVRKLREHADVLERRADALEIRDRNREGARPEAEDVADDLERYQRDLRGSCIVDDLERCGWCGRLNTDCEAEPCESTRPDGDD